MVLSPLAVSVELCGTAGTVRVRVAWWYTPIPTVHPVCVVCALKQDASHGPAAQGYLHDDARNPLAVPSKHASSAFQAVFAVFSVNGTL
jgi:hypothetical protein